jgi:hypothetical protein
MVQTLVKNPATNKFMGIYILNHDQKFEVAGHPGKEFKTDKEAINQIIKMNGFDPDLTRVDLVEWDEY